MVTGPITIQTAAHETLTRLIPVIEKATVQGNSLFGGKLAQSLFHANLGEAWNDPGHIEKALDLLEEIFDDFNSGEAQLPGPFFCNGLSGFAYLLTSFVEKKYLEQEFAAQIKDLLGQLWPHVQEGICSNNNDILHGAIGYLHVLNYYTKVTNERELFNAALQYIETRTALLSMDWIPSVVPGDEISNEIDLGMAHGQSGFLYVLTETTRIAGNHQWNESLKRKLEFVKNCMDEERSEKQSFFPSRIDAVTGKRRTSVRLGWCYSDLGPAWMFFNAGIYTGDRQLLEIADKVGMATTHRRDLEVTGLSNPYLCHGTAGVAHIYQQLFQVSGNPAYQQASEYWIGETITQLDALLQQERIEGDGGGILNGLAGIGLALLSFSTDKKLDWSKTILLS